jgi:hypothetical protein
MKISVASLYITVKECPLVPPTGSVILSDEQLGRGEKTIG